MGRKRKSEEEQKSQMKRGAVFVSDSPVLRFPDSFFLPLSPSPVLPFFSFSPVLSFPLSLW
jgi:hypothetical protein